MLPVGSGLLQEIVFNILGVTIDVRAVTTFSPSSERSTFFSKRARALVTFRSSPGSMVACILSTMVAAGKCFPSQTGWEPRRKTRNELPYRFFRFQPTGQKNPRDSLRGRGRCCCQACEDNVDPVSRRNDQ